MVVKRVYFFTGIDLLTIKKLGSNEIVDLIKMQKGDFKSKITDNGVIFISSR
jgi:hypothetical protein